MRRIPRPQARKGTLSSVERLHAEMSSHLQMAAADVANMQETLRAGVDQAGEKLVQAAASDVALLAHRVPELEEEKIEAQKKQEMTLIHSSSVVTEVPKPK